MEYQIIFEDTPTPEVIINIADKCGAKVKELDSANFGGGIDLVLVANGICALGTIAQIIIQLRAMRNERVVLIRPDGTQIRNITLSEAKKILEESLDDNKI